MALLVVKGRDALRAEREDLPPGVCEIGSCDISVKFSLYNKGDHLSKKNMRQSSSMFVFGTFK